MYVLHHVRMNKPNIIQSVQAWFEFPVFTFLRPQAVPGDALYAIVFTSTPSDVITPGWTVVAQYQGDARLTVLRRAVDGSESSIMSLAIDNAAIGTNICMVFAVRGSIPAEHLMNGINVPDVDVTYFVPSIVKSNPMDACWGIVATNGSSVDISTDASVIVRSNVCDAFSSVQLLVYEVPLMDNVVVPEIIAVLAVGQPGLAASLVIPASP